MLNVFFFIIATRVGQPSKDILFVKFAFLFSDVMFQCIVCIVWVYLYFLSVCVCACACACCLYVTAG